MLVQGASPTHAAQAPEGRSVTVPGNVTGIGRSGLFVAFAATGTRADCRPVRIWNLATRGVHRLGAPRPCPPATSTGSGLVGPVIGGNRALWLTFTGGNLREWSLWTATSTATAPKRLRFVTRDVDEPSPIVLGDGSEAVVPYAVDSTVVGLWPSGARRFSHTAPGRVFALSASRDRVIVLLASGDVLELTADGRVLRTVSLGPDQVIAVEAAAGGFVVKRDRLLNLYRNGQVVHHQPVEDAEELLGFADGVALLRRGTELRGLRLATGRSVVLRTGFHGALAPIGLSYSRGGTVFSVARSRLGL